MAGKILIDMLKLRDYQECKPDGILRDPELNNEFKTIRELATFLFTCRKCSEAPCINVCPAEALEKTENDIQVSLGNRWYDVAVETVGGDEYVLKIDGKVYDVIVTANSNAVAVTLNGKCIQIEKKSAHKLLGGKNSQTKKQDVNTPFRRQISSKILP